MFKMSKEAMKERILEAIQGGNEAEFRRRVEVCLWGLEKSKNGQQLANDLIDDLSLEKYGAKKYVVPAA